MAPLSGELFIFGNLRCVPKRSPGHRLAFGYLWRIAPAHARRSLADSLRDSKLPPLSSSSVHLPGTHTAEHLWCDESPMQSLTKNAVDIFLWHDGLSVGVRDMDMDHHDLLNMLNELHHAVDHDAHLDTVEAIVERIVALTKIHLEREEQLLLEHGYPDEDAAAHHREHDRMIARALMVQASFRCEIPPSLRPPDVIDLTHDLIDHIRGFDYTAGIFLNAQGIY